MFGCNFYSGNNNNNTKKEAQVGCFDVGPFLIANRLFFSSCCFCSLVSLSIGGAAANFWMAFRMNVHSSSSGNEKSPIPFQFPAKSEIFLSNRNWLYWSCCAQFESKIDDIVLSETILSLVLLLFLLSHSHSVCHVLYFPCDSTNVRAMSND